MILITSNKIHNRFVFSFIRLVISAAINASVQPLWIVLIAHLILIEHLILVSVSVIVIIMMLLINKCVN